MGWFFYATLAVSLWAVVNLIDKIIVSGYLQNPKVLFMLAGIFASLPVLTIPFVEFKVIPLGYALVAILAGILFLYGMLPYFYALFADEVSRVIPIGELMPIYVLLFSYVFLGERLTTNQYLGFLLLLAGGISISLKIQRKSVTLRKGACFMLISGLIFATHFVLSKFVYNFVDFWNGFLWIRVGVAIGLLPLFCVTAHRKEFIAEMTKARMIVKLGVVTSETLTLLGTCLFNFAIAIGSVSLVNSMTAAQPMIVFLGVTLISWKYPRLLHEEIHRNTLLLKLAAMSLILAGGGLVYS
jgi:drug/metabolite transporter (DMT)-like permease